MSDREYDVGPGFVRAVECPACLHTKCGPDCGCDCATYRAMQRGFEIAVEHAWISEHDGWVRTAPTIDWAKARAALARAFARHPAERGKDGA